MTLGQLSALLRLRCVPGVGDALLTRRLREHGSLEALLAAPAAVLGKQGRERDSDRTLRRVERMLRTIDELDVRVLTPGDADYPERLLELRTPPLLLFARGDTTLLHRRGVAVVGTRSPTEYGTAVTEQLVSGLACAGMPVWSGGARGIDGVAHATALAEGGATVAVLGCGIDVAYPHEHAELFELIAERGLLLSEFLPGEPPQPSHFPRRNRILAYGAHGVVVIEARPDGGALITADQASDVVPIMAVPGPVNRITSIGPNRLIQEGAKLVMDVRDVLEELGGPLHAQAARPRPSARRRWRPVQRVGGKKAVATGPPAAAPTREAEAGQPGLAPAQLTLHRQLRPFAQHVDELARGTGFTVPRVLELLLELELSGHALPLGGGRYRRAPERPARTRSAPAPDAQPPA